MAAAVRLRVGLFTESYDPVINGVSTSVRTLAVELTGQGHEPVLVAPRFPGFTDRGGDGWPVLRMPSWRTAFNPDNPFVFPPVPGAPSPPVVRGERFDVVHTQQPFGLGLHGRHVASRLGVPLVSTFHTLYHEYTHYFPVLPAPVSRRLLAVHVRNYYNRCAAVVVPSRAAGRILERLGVNGRRLRVVPTGVPPAETIVPGLVEETRRRFSLPETAPVLLYVGRLAREKNLTLVVDAFARLQARHREAEGGARPVLLLAGSGPYAEACRRIVEAAGLAPWVRFAGFLNRGQLAPVYAASTLFVFPSPTETQGVVLSEAQSFGLPCVVAEGGGAPEFVRHGVDALVVPSDDPEAFCAAVSGLLEDAGKRQVMGAAARSSPLRPTPAAMARQMVAVYEEARAACNARIC
jgi:glycosyltransferase involved in cell wall biosynthesis